MKNEMKYEIKYIKIKWREILSIMRRPCQVFRMTFVASLSGRRGFPGQQFQCCRTGTRCLSRRLDVSTGTTQP
jgi:hypothetical protein